MSTPELVPYQHFTDQQSADEFCEMLQQAGIAARVESNAPLVFDPTFANNAPQFIVFIAQSDFEHADGLQEALSEAEFARLPKDYPLFACDNQQLIQILREADKWSVFDVSLAQKLLRERGQPVEREQIEQWRAERIAQMRQYDPAPAAQIAAGYVFAFVGGLLGIFIGWNLRNNSRLLPNGETVFVYSPSVRQHGVYMMLVGALVIVLFAAWNLMQTGI